MLFNGEDNVAKAVATPRRTASGASARSNAFFQAFMISEISLMEEGFELSVRLGAQMEELETPLTVFWARMRPYASNPLARSEVVPTEANMIRLLRTRHPELTRVLPNDARVGALMFGSRGQLLKSAALNVDVPQTFADGSSNPEYEKQVMRKAFGAVLDSGLIVQSAMTTVRFDGPAKSEGPARMMHVVFVRNAEFAEILKQLPKQLKGVAHSGFSSRGEGTPIDRETMNQRLYGLLQTTAPYTFGNWPRGDSAALFVFDAYDQMVAIRSTRVGEDGQLLRIANLISQNDSDIAADDIQAAGISVFPSSPGGRQLDKPIQVVWGRLRPARGIGVRR